MNKLIIKIQTKKKKKSKGFALASVLVVFFVISIIAASYIASVEVSYKMVGAQTLQTEALYLARSGFVYYGIYNSAGELKVDNNKIIIEVVPDEDGIKKNIKSTGVIINESGKEIARQTLIAPSYALEKWHRM